MPSPLARALFLWALACAFTAGPLFAAETSKSTPPEAAVPLKQPDNPAAKPNAPFPWHFAAPKAYEVERIEEIKTKLNGREIWYKGRLPAKTNLTVVLAGPASGPSGPRLTVGVSKFHREIDAEGPERTLRFDAYAYDERSDGKRVKYLSSGAGAADKLGLKQLAQTPWYTLDGIAGAWGASTVSAEGEAWPFADSLRLDRETLLLLPAAKLDDWPKDKPLHQLAVLPFPAPLSPAPTVEVTYRIRDIAGSGSGAGRVASVEFSGSCAATAHKTVEWAGMAFPNADVRCSVGGSLKIALGSQSLLEARVNIQVDVAKPGAEPFEAQFKLESSWKAVK
ncbi:MAG: hypothetical protein HY291_23535 [Planctomycetes bacterium]|nr:hypothetical protein [Planctomycetota bacterium]